MSQSTNDRVSVNVMRSSLGRARGAGSGHSGVHHWYAERVTSIALVPLTIWFVISVLRLVGASQSTVATFVGHPLNAALLLALIVMTFHHMQLGIQVVLEDYVPNPKKMMVFVLINKGVALMLGLIAAISVLKLALA